MTREHQEELTIGAIIAALLLYMLWLARRPGGPAASFPPIVPASANPLNGGTVEINSQPAITLDTIGIPAFSLPSSQGDCNCGGGCGSSANSIPSLSTIVAMTNNALSEIYNDGSAAVDTIASIGSNQWINYSISNG